MKYTYILIMLLLSSCVRQPEEPAKPDIQPGKTGAYILCEALKGSNSSSLDRYDRASGNIANSYFTGANPDWTSLGDVANHIVLMGDTAFIAVTGSNYIEIIRVSDGKHINKIILPDRATPRRIYIYSRSLAFVSNLYENTLTEFNPTTFQVIGKVRVGPAPEAVTGYGNYVFAANSGLGDYWADSAGAGTVSVIDVVSGQEITKLNAGPDVVELAVSHKYKRLYAAYVNSPTKPDLPGGIVEYDINTLKERGRIEIPKFDLTRFAFSSTGDTLFFLNKEGVAFFDLASGDLVPKQYIINPSGDDFWSALAFSLYDNTLWVGNAKNYQVKGEVYIYITGSAPSLEKTLVTGYIPNTIVFF